MLFLISHDHLKAVDARNIDFYYISPDKNFRGKFALLAKTQKSPAEDGCYDFLILFEHEDIQIVKATMKFLLAFQIACPDDFILHVDLDSLYKLGMKVAPELLRQEFNSTKEKAAPKCDLL